MINKLYVLISTIDSRIFNIKDILQPFDEKVHYIISHQNSDEVDAHIVNFINELKQREDVSYSALEGRGVAINRNNTLKFIEPSAICLILDDDVILCKNAFSDVLRSFREHPSADFISFKILDLEDKDFKSYPKTEQWHSLRTLTGIGTTEIAFKSDFVLNNNIRFDENFGPGSELYPSGEDFIFTMELYKRKAKMLFLPIPIVKHPKNSTGNTWNSKIIFAKGAVFAKVFGYISFLLDLYFSFKHQKEYKEQYTFYQYLKIMVSGSYDFLSRKLDR